MCDGCDVLYNYITTQADPWQVNLEGFGCEVVASIFSWSYMFFFLSFFGTIGFLLGNIGNSNKCEFLVQNVNQFKSDHLNTLNVESI